MSATLRKNATSHGKGSATASPIGWKNFNYTIVALLVVIGFAGIYWLVSARNWFTGPRVQGTAEELAAIESELS